jgi:hypothetical protein
MPEPLGVSLATAKRVLARAEARFFRLTERDPVLSAWVRGREEGP